MSRKKTAPPKKKYSTLIFRAVISVVLLLTIALIYLDAKVKYNLNERQWQLPARVYARALILDVGKTISTEELSVELRLLGYKKHSDVNAPGIFNRVGSEFWIYFRGVETASSTVKPQRIHVLIQENQVALLESDDGEARGTALNSIEFEPLEIGSIYPRHQEDRILVQLASVPTILPKALVVVEDQNFYDHFGLSITSIGRALVANIKAGKTVQGGSTITQQLVKNVFLNRGRNLWRKVVEAIMAVLVEIHFSKDEILESYINEVYLGQEGARSIHGFALASKHYFNRPLRELTVGQTAMLVGMVKGPAYYNPWRYPERAKQRRNTVLQVMAEHDLIDLNQLSRYREEALSLSKSSALEGVYPAYIDLVRRQLRRDYSGKSLQTDGLKIFTAFDPLVQSYAEKSLGKVLSTKAEGIEGAMVVTDVSSGDVVAVVGGKNMRYAGFNRALDAIRPVGSLMKPVIYLAALEDPDEYTLASTVSDRAFVVNGENGTSWKPRNFSRQEHGDVLLHRALSHSYNKAAARLGMEVGLDKVLLMAERLGLKRTLASLPSMLLGAGALSPFEVAGMYQTIAASGVYSPLRTITDIADSNATPVARYPISRTRVVESGVMHLLHYSMLEVVREGTGKSAYAKLPVDFAVAGKTGTTNDLRDSWFAGYAGDYLSVVWLGRDDNKSAGLTGSNGALKVWTEFINQASRKPLDFSVPANVAYHWIDERSGLLSREVCEGARFLPFLQGTAPTARSSCKATVPGVWKWFKRLF
jgi:penicillin-binding protein 1B